jgi:hypothetical protein
MGIGDIALSAVRSLDVVRLFYPLLLDIQCFLIRLFPFCQERWQGLQGILSCMDKPLFLKAK